MIELSVITISYLPLMHSVDNRPLDVSTHEANEAMNPNNTHQNHRQTKMF